MLDEEEDELERSASGAPIWRHQDEAEFELALGDSDNIERIVEHIERYIGPVDNVFHELISDQVHIDVHVINPTEKRPFYTLVTSGMSDKPMNAPAEYPELAYSELMICLPPDWPMGDEAFKQNENYWPVYCLKHLARFPHQYKTWLWSSHTVPNGDPPAPFAANTRLCCALVISPVTVPEGFQQLIIDDHKTIHFHAIVPLTEDEMNHKLQGGVEALFDGFDRLGVSEILDPARPSSLAPKPKKRWWQR